MQNYKPDLEKSLPEILLASFNKINASNIPIFDHVLTAINASNFDEANALNATIVSSNSLEENWQITNSIYLNSLSDVGEILLNDDDRSTLLSIAKLPPQQNGFGVYNAWGMLDTIIHYDITDEEFKLMNTPQEQFLVYPNPIINNFQISGDLHINDIVEITNLQGAVQKSFVQTKSMNIIDVSDLNGGIYMIQIKREAATIFSKKMVILKSTN